MLQAFALVPKPDISPDGQLTDPEKNGATQANNEQSPHTTRTNSREDGHYNTMHTHHDAQLGNK